MDIEKSLKEAERWFDINGVEGIAQGKSGNEDCITVFLSNPESKDKIPTRFHDFPVCIEFTNEFLAAGD